MCSNIPTLSNMGLGWDMFKGSVIHVVVDVPENLIPLAEQLPEFYIYSPLYPSPKQLALWRQMFEEAQYDDGKSRPGWDKDNGFYSHHFNTKDLKLPRDINA